MRIFFSLILGIICVAGAIISVPISTNFMNKAAENLEHFWRWRLLGIVTLLAGVGLVIFAFLFIPRILK